MTEIINCPSCGASNQLPEGKNTMFCAFCGSLVRQNFKQSNNELSSSIKSKPKISEKIVEMTEGESMMYHCLTHEYRRVPGGVKYWNEIGSYWDFIPDEEKVVDKGGELILTNRGIKSLTEVIEWFSDNELKEVRILDLSDNEIESFNELSVFKNVEKVNFKRNKINKFPEILVLEHLHKIDLNENPIPNNYIFENWKILGGTEIIIDKGLLIAKPEKNNCQHCGTEITKIEFNSQSGQCKKCYDDFPRRIASSLLDDMDNSKQNSKCFIATATMGSYDHPMVMELRFFRDNWILQQKWGNSFVRWYYVNGAIVAKFIEKSFVLKKLSFILIVKPLVFLSRFLKNHSI